MAETPTQHPTQDDKPERRKIPQQPGVNNGGSTETRSETRKKRIPTGFLLGGLWSIGLLGIFLACLGSGIAAVVGRSDVKWARLFVAILCVVGLLILVTLLSRTFKRVPRDDSAPGTFTTRVWRSSPVRFILGVWRWIAAPYAALGIAEAIRHWWHFEWHGYFGAVAHLWGGMRAIADGFFHGSVTIPSDWLGWQIEVPLWLRDYLAIGVVVAASIVRETGDGWLETARDSFEDFLGSFFLWPVYLVIACAEAASYYLGRRTKSSAKAKKEARLALLIASPLLFYTPILLILNFLVMPHIS